jgi:hypothetical protein
MLTNPDKYREHLSRAGKLKLKALRAQALGENPQDVRLRLFEALAEHLRAMILHEPPVVNGHITFDLAHENDFGEALGLLREIAGATDKDIARVLKQLKPVRS